jgi:predicted RNase H-like nuclease
MTVVAGVDAYRRGWVAVVADEGRFVGSFVAPTFAEILEQLDSSVVIGVDTPIGLPTTGSRAADLAARAFVGPRRSSVFPTPTRAAITCATYADARRVVPSLAAQSFALGRKILEVEANLEARVFELHPEVSFTALAGRHLHYSKRSWNGQMERRRLLTTTGLRLPDELDSGGEAAADDVLDAAIGAWTASRKQRGEARTLPDEPPLENGRLVAIHY